MTEIWRPIPGHEGSYEASSLGRIRSLDRKVWVAAQRCWRFQRGKVLAPRLSSHGYLTVSLGKCSPRGIHRLVCMAFHGPPPFPGAEAAHRDGARENNLPSNLYWATREQNRIDAMRHGTLNGPRRRLPRATVQEIRRLGRQQPFRLTAERYGVSRCTVADIINGRTHKSAGE